jgi:Domain of unknown function (DUF4129)
VRAGQLVRLRRRRHWFVPAASIKLFPFNLGRQGAGSARRPGMQPLSDGEDLIGWLLLAWEELREDLGLSGLPPRPNETPLEWARRASDELMRRGTLTGQEQLALVEIGAVVSPAAYGRWCPSKAELRLLNAEAHLIGQRARASLRWRQRLFYYGDPRST